jgi:hypothetical protein
MPSCKLGGYLEYPGDAALGIPPAKFSWSYPVDFFDPVEVKEYRYKSGPTLAEEVWEHVQTWYRSQGKSVPVAEATACIQAIKDEKKPMEPLPEQPKTAEDILGPRPTWGDPLYWSWWNKAKALGLVQEKKKKSPKAEKVSKVSKIVKKEK